MKQSSEEQAAILAALLMGGERGLERWSAAAAEGLREYLALSSKRREQRLAGDLEQLLAPLAHAELVHPSWREEHEAYDDAEPSAARWLAQRARGELCDMPARLASAEAIFAAVESLGRARLALALRRTPPAAQAAVAARLPEDHARALLVELRAPVDEAAVSSAVRELAELVHTGELLFRAGARHLGPALVGEGDLARQLAQRLPRERGVILLEELERARSSSEIVASDDAKHVLRELQKL